MVVAGMFLPFIGASLRGNTVSAVNGLVSIPITPKEMVLDLLPLALFYDSSLMLFLPVICSLAFKFVFVVLISPGIKSDL